MNTKLLYGFWAAFYILCVGLGTFEEPEGLLKIAMVCLAVLFFLPGGYLLWDAITRGKRRSVLTIRLISASSLVLTLAALIAFFITTATENAAAAVLYEVLILVSSPMICGQYWFISLFLWACLLCGSFVKPKSKQ